METGCLQDVKAIIKSLVLSSPTVITIDKLNKDFREAEGFFIPFRKLGYSNLEVFLHSISDTVQVIGGGPNGIVRYVSNKKSDHIHQMICQQKIVNRSKKKSNFKIIRHKENYSTSGLLSKENIDQQSCFTKQTTKYTHGYNNVNNNIKNATFYKKEIKSDFECIVNQGQLQQLPSNDVQESSKYKHNISMLKNAEVLPPDSKVNLQDKILSLETALKSTVVISDITKENPFIMDCQSEETTFSQPSIKQHFEEAIPEFAANSLVFSFDFPEHAVTFGKQIPRYELPADLSTNSVIGIFISEIHNPFKFWFQMHKANHELDILMRQMELFYMSLDDNEYCIPSVCISPGQICAALFNGMWHRAEILKSVINNKAKVLFVDYATIAEVKIMNIKYLPTMYANTPTQAIRGSLSHITPRGLHWSVDATQFFLSLVSNSMLYAQVSEIDEINRVLYMVLCNTNGNDVIQINKTLIRKGFAMYNEKWTISKIKKSGLRLRHLREEFPTHSMIEKGEYPSFKEIGELLKQNIDYENIIDHHIFHPGVLSECENTPDVIRNLPFQLLTTNPFRCEVVMQINRMLKSNSKYKESS